MAFAFLQHAQIEATQGFVHGIEQRVFENIDIRQLFYPDDQPVHDRLAGGVLVVDDTVPAVTGFERFAHGAVRVEVKVHAQLFDAQHVAGTFLDELFNCLDVVFIFAGNQRVGDMQLIIIVNGVEYAGDAALSERRVG